MGMIFLSEEDVDVGRLLASWVRKQPDDMQSKLSGWLEDLFNRALEWVLRANAFVVDTTKVGTVMNALSYLADCRSKGEFVQAIIRGLGGNLPVDLRAKFANDVFGWANERAPNPKTPLDCFYHKESASFKNYTSDLNSTRISKEDFMRSGQVPLVRTVADQRNLDQFAPWLKSGEPFLVVGPEGCGKSLLLRHAFGELKSTQVATLHCNAQTTAQHVIQKLEQMCSMNSSAQGRVLRPKDSGRLVLYLKDINLPKPDRYETMQLLAFLQQLLTYKGFYDSHLEFVHLERIQLVASINPSTNVGRYGLATRFTANVRIAVLDYPDNDDLQAIYTQFLKAILVGTKSGASLVPRLAQSMVELYQHVRAKFSVDEHRHYLFTPRDLTQWCLSLLRYGEQLQHGDGESLLELWAYEAQRVFRDRLVGQDAALRFDTMLLQQLRSAFSYAHPTQLKNFFYTSLANVSDASSKQVLGGLGAPLSRLSADDLRKIVQQSMVLYEREFKDLGLLLMDEVLEHIAKLDRVLSNPGGSMLLVGRSGVGRRSLTTIVAYMQRMTLVSPSLTREYGVKELKRDLKAWLQTAGVEGQPLVLLLEDHQFVQPAFLELFNSLLSAGEVPGLYQPEELEPMLAPLKDAMAEQGTHRTLFDFFVSRVQANLRIVLSMDPTNPSFAVACASNPALYTRCSIVWMDAWSRDSMKEVVEAQLKDLLSDLTAAESDSLYSILLQIHKSCLPRGVTPKHLITFIRTYAKVYLWKQKSQSGQTGHLTAGLQKLGEAHEMVDELSRNAISQKKELAHKQQLADQALQNIELAMDKAADRRKEVKVLQANLQEEEVIVSARKQQIEVELGEIQPTLDAARKAVGSIRPEHLNEIRSFSMPPEPIHDVLSGVLRLMDNFDTSWISMKKFLGQRSVVHSIVGFDARSIKKETRQEVEKLLAQKGNSFEPAVIQRSSLAAAPLAAWVKANIKYSYVLEKIEPLQRDLDKATRTLSVSADRLNKCEEQLVELDREVTRLKNEFGKCTAEAEQLKIGLQKAEGTLAAAQELLGKLSGEKERWQTQVSGLERDLETLPTQALLSSGFITYLAGTPEDVRQAAVHEWIQLAGAAAQEWRLLQFMATESELLQWKTQGLPSDQLSMENAIVIQHTTSCPLIIDPATQATEWLRTHLSASGPVEVLLHQDPRLHTQLELAVRFGKTLIIQEVDNIDPMLFPLLRRDLIKQGPRFVVQLGDKLLDYNDSFHLVLCTRDSHMILAPSAASLVCEVNFTVTRSGLEGQLLGLILQHEQPELELKKTQLLQQEEQLKVQLAALEKGLLEQLATSEGNILENRSLIQSLNDTKAKSNTIAASLQDSKQLQSALDEQRDVYRVLAARGSAIFILMRDLQRVSGMYQFALASFLGLFMKVLQVNPIADSVTHKLNLLERSLMQDVFFFVSRSLFKANRIMWGVHLVHGVNTQNIAEAEWGLFLGELVTSGAKAQVPSWCPTDRREAASHLFSCLSRVSAGLQLESTDQWQAWIKSATCETEFPVAVKPKLSAFQRLLFVQAFRPDRLESAMQLFVAESLGVGTIAQPPLSLSKLHDELQESTNSADAILFITTPGSDPSKELEEFAEQTVGSRKFQQMAMGGGQNDIAVTMLREAARNGHWLCLKNLHLVTSWLPQLEKELKSLHPQKGFRLWLTTEAHSKFPPILLESSLKITYESPPGIKKNLQRTFESWGPQFIEHGSPLRSQMLFTLAWFHAVMQERRTYIPQGWTKFYEFASNDLRSGTTMIEQWLQGLQGGQVTSTHWQTVHGLLENSIYGGRIDNEFDLRVLKAYLQQYFASDALLGSAASRRPLAQGVVVPSSNQSREYLQLIGNLPDIDAPILFGLPPNIDRSVQRYNSGQVLNQLKQLALAAGETQRFDKEKWATQLGPLLQLWQTLSSGWPKTSPPTMRSNASPVDIFIFMQASDTNAIVEVVSSSLSHLSKVIYGGSLLTSSIQTQALSLLTKEVPEAWRTRWEGPDDPTQWLKELVKKKLAMDNWLQKSTQGTLLSQPLNLSELLHPDTFLNALRQQTARQLKVAMDTMKLVSSFEASRLSRAAVTVCVEGLLVQGCAVEGGVLMDADANANELVSLPPCYLAFISESETEPHTDNTVAVPVYHTLGREALLCQLKIPTVSSPSVRVISGVAIFLSDSL
eukprot:GILK01007609.1.p1 GENE.GILK01007609.1~~GILK01007609.1.p1  ORF type:complete len:2172 (-),score=437.61 GILK01007609.1:43-6558(-)